MSAKKETFFQSLWNFFCSLKLTIITLILLAVTSIIGTVIQQNRPAAEYIQQYGESTYRFFLSFQLTDMYHSWWFLALLVLFCINLTACSIKRFPHVWKSVRQPLLVADETQFRLSANADELLVDAPPARVRDQVADFLGGRFAAPTLTEREGRLHFYAQKAPWARLGVYVTHLSILVIFIGAIIGNLWGFKAYVNIAEGTEESRVWPQNGGAPIELGFAVRCDDFEVTYYDGSNRPKEFMSILDIVDQGQEVVSDRKIIVNDPITYKGITFYQSSYGPAGDPTVQMRVKPSSGGEPLEISARQGEQVALPGGYSFAVTGFTPSYNQFGPAVQMHLNTPEGKHGNPFIVLQNFPDFDARRGGEFAFALLGFSQPQFTGLQVKKDPGVWVVWLGCTLLVLGSLVAFFLSHRRIWVSIEEQGGRSRVRLCGSAHRNQPAFELYFDQFKKDLRQQLAPSAEGGRDGGK
ncbi:cytochrome c biogenesis protein ResB [Desulfuromonas versatilis]|uniref:Cytochrome c biogenesis protein ResB n=1 Tax=Desulfuromonas versatilis TaxID=2802975 RepID=A0ABN6DUB2_9BACT|nr:cytochrome c biogenesis protein ResB [Desulfuromonas versatilis]BCR03690.1 cytochrome c biogenesis protein ResB [Desulfuromonas versatilis]